MRHLKCRIVTTLQSIKVNTMVDMVIAVCQFVGAGAAVVIGLALLGIAVGKIKV